jgi:hypothetical protein
MPRERQQITRKNGHLLFIADLDCLTAVKHDDTWKSSAKPLQALIPSGFAGTKAGIYRGFHQGDSEGIIFPQCFSGSAQPIYCR